MMKLDYHVFKAAVNWYLGRQVGGAQRPVFFDIESQFPELAAVTQKYLAIRTEFDRLLESRRALPRYHDIDSGEAKISDTTPHNWKVFMLDILGHRPAANRQQCPATCAALERVPHLVQAFFSILDPGKSIPEHEGPYLGYLRYHLALRVPKRKAPRLIVNAQPYVWEEGQAVLFDDSWPHAVENFSDEPRGVLVVDVMRPLTRAPHVLNWLVTQVIAKHTYGRKVARKAEMYTVDVAAEAPPSRLRAKSA